MDSDLEESISALKNSLKQLDLPRTFGKADPAVVQAVTERFSLPRRYRDFLLESDPLDVETATPAERVRLLPAAELELEQSEYAVAESGDLITQPTRNGWRPGWIVIAHSGLLGDPYFLDVTNVDAEGDCPVYSAMSGTDTWHPKLCASGLATFIRILAVTMDVAEDFDLDDYDPDNERVFREAVGARVREVDPAAFKGGHWT